MNLKRVKGLGPRKIEALAAAGINTIESLAAIDLRRNIEIDGITRDALVTYKQRARAVLRENGKPVPKAPRRDNGTVTITTKPQARGETRHDRPDAEKAPAKRGFLARLLRN